VYALLSLAFEESDLGIDVDYSVSAASLFTQLAGHQIIRHGRLQYLSMAGLSIASPLPSIPTWVANWSVCDNIFMSLGVAECFSASGTSNAKTELKGAKNLLITGIFIDTVQDVGRRMLPHRCDMTDPNSEENIHRGKTDQTWIL
jgi:hypothetical protein